MSVSFEEKKSCPTTHNRLIHFFQNSFTKKDMVLEDVTEL